MSIIFEIEIVQVDEGIEAMLCCWLQQLQEFGGPEVEKPDLLQGSVGSLKPQLQNSTGNLARHPVFKDPRARYNVSNKSVRYLRLYDPVKITFPIFFLFFVSPSNLSSTNVLTQNLSPLSFRNLIFKITDLNELAISRQLSEIEPLIGFAIGIAKQKPSSASFSIDAIITFDLRAVIVSRTPISA